MVARSLRGKGCTQHNEDTPTFHKIATRGKIRKRQRPSHDNDKASWEESNLVDCLVDGRLLARSTVQNG